MLVTTLLAMTLVASAQDDPARADDDRPPVSIPVDPDQERGIALFNNGKVLFDEGNYAAALLAWQRAYELTDEPLLLFNMASAYERSGEYGKALESLNQFRALGRVQDPETLMRRIRSLEAQQDVAARRDENADPAPEPTATPPVPSKASDPRTRVAGVTLVGAGSVGIATGAVLGGLAGSASNRAQIDCLDSLCLDTAKPDVDAARRLARGADVAWITGAVVLGTGVVLLANRRGKGASSLSVGPGGAMFSGTF